MFVIERVDDIHPRCNLSNRRKPLLIEHGIIAQIDKQLRRARIGAGRCKRERSASIRRLHGVVLNRRFAPNATHQWRAVNSELNDKPLDHSEQGNIFKKSRLDEIIKPVDAIRCPIAVHFDDDAPLCRFDFDIEKLGRLRIEGLGREEASHIGRAILLGNHCRFFDLCGLFRRLGRRRLLLGRAARAQPHPQRYRKPQ